MRQTLFIFYMLIPLTASILSAQVPEIYPESSGGFFGVSYTRTENTFNSRRFGQRDSLDFIGINLGLVQNERFYYKLSAGAGYATSSGTEFPVPGAFSGILDNENGFHFNAGARFGYNIDLGTALRIRPVLGYKIDHLKFSLKNGNQAQRNHAGTDLEYTWHGYTYGIEADLQLSDAVVLFAGFDFFEASPNTSSSGSALNGGSVHSQSWDGDGTEFHVGILGRIDAGVLFLRAFRQSWSADGSDGASWDVKNSGIMFGGGFGF